MKRRAIYVVEFAAMLSLIPAMCLWVIALTLRYGWANIKDRPMGQLWHEYSHDEEVRRTAP